MRQPDRQRIAKRVVNRVCQGASWQAAWAAEVRRAAVHPVERPELAAEVLRLGRRRGMITKARPVALRMGV